MYFFKWQQASTAPPSRRTSRGPSQPHSSLDETMRRMSVQEQQQQQQGGAVYADDQGGCYDEDPRNTRHPSYTSDNYYPSSSGYGGGGGGVQYSNNGPSNVSPINLVYKSLLTLPASSTDNKFSRLFFGRVLTRFPL